MLRKSPPPRFALTEKTWSASEPHEVQGTGSWIPSLGTASVSKSVVTHQRVQLPRRPQSRLQSPGCHLYHWKSWSSLSLSLSLSLGFPERDLPESWIKLIFICVSSQSQREVPGPLPGTDKQQSDTLTHSLPKCVLMSYVGVKLHN